MPRTRCRPAVLLVTLLLAAVPAGAHAQGSAGDDQYQDPFSGQTSGGGSKGSGGSLGSAPPATTPATPGSPAPATGAGPPQALPAELARTGADLRLELGAGVLLLIGGLALRRRADGR